jgi:hypothetical protein
MFRRAPLTPTRCRRTAAALVLATSLVATSSLSASAANPPAGTTSTTRTNAIASTHALTNTSANSFTAPRPSALPVNSGGTTSVRGLPFGLGSGGNGPIQPVALQPLILNPTRTLTIDNHYSHISTDSWCVTSLQEVGLAPDLDVAALDQNVGKVAVGFSHYYDAGTDPFPCDAQADTYYRGGVGFDMNAVNTLIGADNGQLNSASLIFQQDSGSQSCIDHIAVNSDPWESWNGATQGDLPDGGLALYPQMTPRSVGGFTGQVGVTAPLALSVGLGGGAAAPHLHFVFVGKDENIYAQDNDSCDSTISNLVLGVYPKI